MHFCSGVDIIQTEDSVAIAILVAVDGETAMLVVIIEPQPG